MDTVTHTLFGLTIYGAANKENMPKAVKRSVFVAAVAGGLIPDIDVISQLWDTEGMYQMWHRGITHSIYMVPVWALLIWLFCYLIWKVHDRRILYIATISLLIHISSDALNAWGTGYFEPFSSIRVSYGILPIVDVVIWSIMLMAFLVIKIKKATSYKVWRIAWVFILIHVILQATQGYIVYQSTADYYEKQALTARFIPGHFKIIGKDGPHFEVLNMTAWSAPELVHEVTSKEDIDLDILFEENPAAKTLMEWSPFVVVVEEEDKLGIYDPRFYRMDEPMLFEFILRETK